MAQVKYNQAVRIGSCNTSVPKREAIEDWTWNRVKFYSFIFACLAAVALFLGVGYWLGGSGCYTCTQNQPAPVAGPAAPKSQAPASADPAVAEQIKALTAIAEKLASTPAPAPAPAVAPAPTPAQASASASASAKASSISALPPIIIWREYLKPPPQANPPAPKPSVQPCASVPPAKVRSCLLWAPLNQG